VVVDDRVRAVATPALLRLREVLEHRHQLQSLARSRGGEHIQVGDGGDVGRLIEHEEQRRIERFSTQRARAVELLDHLLDQRHEQRPEAVLITDGRAEIEGVRAAV
jgi:hypothetical protein